MSIIEKDENTGEVLDKETKAVEEKVEEPLEPIEEVVQPNAEIREEVLDEMPTVVKQSPYIIGIDLGTSTSSVAVFYRDQPQLVNIEGTRFMPSVVHVDKTGEILVGRQAKDMMLIDPDNTVASIKREMGNHDYVKEFKGLPEKKFTPADISAEILKKILKEARENAPFDLQGEITKAVICVPANFEDNKKRNTIKAGKAAGLEEVHLLDEPVAAAISYGYSTGGKDQKIMVYDLGGGTFDVSILEVKTSDDADPTRDKFKVLASEGIAELGGDDFDLKLMELLHDRLRRAGSASTDHNPGNTLIEKDEETGEVIDTADSGTSEMLDLDIFDLQKDQGINKNELRKAQKKLKEAAEKAKVELTTKQSTKVSIPEFLKDGGRNMTHHIEETVSRKEFESLIKDKVAQTESCVRKALDSANLSMDDIDRIVLVGGSTLVPLVREMPMEMFGREPYRDDDPTTTVARGAAIYADWLTKPERIRVLPQVRHYMGIALAGGKFATLLEKNADIPSEGLSVEQEYVNPRDSMTDFRIAVYQADDPVDMVNEKSCKYVEDFLLEGITPAPQGKTRIKVNFSIDTSNLLSVTASSVGSDNISQKLDVTVE